MARRKQAASMGSTLKARQQGPNGRPVEVIGSATLGLFFGETNQGNSQLHILYPQDAPRVLELLMDDVIDCTPVDVQEIHEQDGPSNGDGPRQLPRIVTP